MEKASFFLGSSPLKDAFISRLRNAFKLVKEAQFWDCSRLRLEASSQKKQATP
jgi:hypothetical protein